MFWAWTAGLSLALVTAIVASVAVGAVQLPFATVSSVIVQKLFGLGATTWSPVEAQIVWDFRLPRVLTLGSGAVAGLSLPLAAFLGALATMLAVYALARKHARATPTRLILAGVAVGYVLSSLTSFMVLRKSQPGSGVSSVLYWLAGSLGGAKWEQLGIPALALLVATVLLMLRARPLNALLVGEESAVGLGVNLERFRLELFVLTSLLVGVAVAVSGAIGFVGLMVPHVVRMLVGSDHRRVLPVAALLGGTYLVLVDLVGRTIIAPVELPVGIVTAAIGGPFFLWLMRRNARTES